MTTSEQINDIAAACAKAQAELRPAVKDATNPAFRSRYADHAAIVEAAKVYHKYGVAVFQDVTLTEAGSAVVTRLAHSSGQWIEFGPLTVPLAKRDAHGVGSATTYAKRYALSAALGIAADEDDDGNAATAPAAGRWVESNYKPVPMQPGPELVPESELPPAKTITEKQRLALVSAAGQAGWKAAEVGAMLQARFGVTRSHQIPAAQYDAVLQVLKDGVDHEEVESRG